MEPAVCSPRGNELLRSIAVWVSDSTVHFWTHGSSRSGDVRYLFLQLVKNRRDFIVSSSDQRCYSAGCLFRSGAAEEPRGSRFPDSRISLTHAARAVPTGRLRHLEGGTTFSQWPPSSPAQHWYLIVLLVASTPRELVLSCLQGVSIAKRVWWWDIWLLWKIEIKYLTEQSSQWDWLIKRLQLSAELKSSS